MAQVSAAQLVGGKEKSLGRGVEPYLALFEHFQRKTCADMSSWISAIRQQAISSLARIGFPTIRQEDWKYTSVEPLLKHSFVPAIEPESSALTNQQISSFLFGESNWKRLVFVNGFYVPTLSFLSQTGDGLKLESLANAVKTHSDILEPHLARYAHPQANGFIALNTALFQDGALIYVPKGKAIQGLIHIIYFSCPAVEKTMSQPRNIILADENSNVTVIESFVGLGKEPYFTNSVTEIVLKQSASVHYYKIQDERPKAFHIATTQVHLGCGSVFHSYSFSLGGGLIRNDLNVVLNQEGGECLVNGLYLAKGTQHVDHHTAIDHTKPQGTSRQLYKGVLDGNAKAVFNGKIFVSPNAQRTDAQQTNKNLLLSENATVDTKPQLEIFADDVKCTHGAAVGQLDEDAAFYLRSRGLSEEHARSVLTYGFASEVIQSVEVESIRAKLSRWLWAWLGKAEGDPLW